MGAGGFKTMYLTPGADPGGWGVDWVASHPPLEQPRKKLKLKKDYKLEIRPVPKTRTKPTSLTMYKGAIQLNIYARNRNTQCDRLVISTYARKSCYSSTTGRQRHRENQPTESDAKYWKRTVTIPFLDVICS